MSAGGAEEELIRAGAEDALEVSTAIGDEMLDVAITGKAKCVAAADSVSRKKAVAKAFGSESLNMVLLPVEVLTVATPIGTVESVLVAVKVDMALRLVLIVDSSNDIWDSGLCELYGGIEISA